MSKQALYDAFEAGWNMARASYAPHANPQALFDTWYANAIATGERTTANPAMQHYNIMQDIAAEGQRAATYHGGLAKRRRERDNS